MATSLQIQAGTSEISQGLQAVLNTISKAETLGKRYLPNGTTLIGSLMRHTPDMWLHAIFPPLAERRLALLAERFSCGLPDAYREFLSLNNGMKLYGGALTLYGVRDNYKNDREVLLSQPNSITSPNQKLRPKDAEKSFLFIGESRRSGMRYYIDTDTNKCYRCSKESAVPLEEWGSFMRMLLAETKRLDALYCPAVVSSRGPAR